MNVGQGEEPGRGAPPLYNSWGHANDLLVKDPTDQFVMGEWILKVKAFSSPALEDASKKLPHYPLY